MNRYSRLDNQAPAVKEMESNDVNVGRSAHDCSHIVNGNALIGMLAPVLTMEVVLNEDIDINLASLIEFRNPTTRQLFNSFRVYFHGYFNALTDLWEGARNWLDNGRSGKIQLTRPNLIYHVHFQDDVHHVSSDTNACTPMSLLNFMGMPSEVIQNKVSASTDRVPLRQFECASDAGKTFNVTQNFTKVGESTDYFPADVCMAYQRNWRDFYSNKNLLQNNKFWFPDNEDHFILSYSCTDAVCISYENEAFTNRIPVQGANRYTCQISNLTGTNPLSYGAVSSNTSTPEPNNPATNTPLADLNEATYAPNLAGIKFRQFRGDRFTTGSPFPELIRGDIPVLNITQDNYAPVKFYDNPDPETSNQVSLQVLNGVYLGDSPYQALGVMPDTLRSTEILAYSDLSNITSSITMSDIYTLETLSAFRRKMGMTNGDYAETMQSQFGVRPKIHDRKGTYIGGFYQDFAFSAVTQTSESNETPLGTKAGQGISSGSGRIGHIHTTDFGWIQVYMSIMPDVYYTQGKPRQFSKRSNMEMYFPIFNNLPAQAIRNDELFISGNSTTDSSPFAYEDRYAEFKSMQNRVCGLMGLPVANAEFDTARVIARRFSSTPALNHLFVSAVPENIDMSVFSVVDEPPFDFSIGFSIRRVFPGPYAAVEGSLSSPKLNA